ncbi:MAG TPA: co-chaperone GroES, partial [Candidatus Acetothermia bacterium]|nr:co-chaperone GroES [Candidatus Acetothermia bacterium]
KFTVKKGNEIIVSSFAGTEIEVDDEKLLLVKESDVLAVIE